MSDQEYLDLKEPGARVSMLVERVARAKSKFGQDYVFVGRITADRTVGVSVPEKATERQLEKVLKINKAEETVGRFLTISRSEQPATNGKLYWNIEWADENAFADLPDGMRPVEGTVSRRMPEGAKVGGAAPVTDEERDAAAARRAARVALLVKAWHKLWAQEADFQLAEAAKRDDPGGVDSFPVTGESINAGAAVLWIQIMRENLV